MIVTLTDFGDNEYLGVMKGVISSISPNAKVVDLFNHVSRQNVKEGAWILYNNYKFFPKETIFLCVVDPGVGSERQSVVIRTENYYFVGPDNGLMFPAAQDDGIILISKLSEEDSSDTFHGRDVYAKAAAKYENGEFVGKESSLQVELHFHLEGREGEVMRIDTYGNVITNIPNLYNNDYTIDGKRIRYYNIYAEAGDNELFIIESSCKTLELSIKNGSANEQLNLRVGDRIKIE